MTKYRKSATKTAGVKTAPVAEQKTGSDYNPETWTQQFFREKREAEERAAETVKKDRMGEGEKIEKGIPTEKGIPVCEV